VVVATHNVRRVWQRKHQNRGRVPSPVVLFGVEQELEEFGLNNVVDDVYLACRVVDRLLLLMKEVDVVKTLRKTETHRFFGLGCETMECADSNV
jgi:hypothetical protein